MALVWASLRRNFRHGCLIRLPSKDGIYPLIHLKPASKTVREGFGFGPSYSTDPAQPGSAASLLQLLQVHRHEGKLTPSRIPSTKTKRQSGKARRPKTDPKVSSKLLTSNVVATFKQTVAKLDQASLSVDEKLKEAQNCIKTFSKLGREEELSDINIAAIMHRTARIAMHESLRKLTSEPLTQALGHGELLKKLADMVISRAESFFAAGGASKGASHGKGAASDTSGDDAHKHVLNSSKEMESVASLTLYSCAMSGVSIPEPGIELLSSVIYNTRDSWEVPRMVMVALTFGRYRTQPLEGKLHQALTRQAFSKLGYMSAEELTTMLWGFAQASFKPGTEFVNAALAELLPKVHQTPEIGIINCLEALPMLEWATRIPPVNSILPQQGTTRLGKGEGGEKNGHRLSMSLLDTQRRVERQRANKRQKATRENRAKESKEKDDMQGLVLKALQMQMDRERAMQLAREASLIAESLSPSPDSSHTLSSSSTTITPTIPFKDEEDEVRHVYSRLLDQDSLPLQNTKKILQLGNLLLEAHVTDDGHLSSSVVQPHYEATHLLPNSANGVTGDEQAKAEAAALCISMLLTRAKDIISTIRVDQAVRIVRCAGLLRHLNEELQAAVALCVQQALRESEPYIPSPLVASEFLWSYATLGVGEMLNPGFGKQIVTTVLESNYSPEEWSPLIASRMAWSLAALNELDVSLLRRLSNKVMVEMGDDPIVKSALEIGSKSFRADSQASDPEATFSPNERSERDDPERVMLNHIYQAALHLQVATGQSIASMDLPEPLFKAGSAAWNDRDKFLTTSAIQRQVGSAMQALGLHCTLEYRPPGTPIIIDIAVQHRVSRGKTQKPVQIAVEVDGPYHFLASHPTRALGSARLRNSLLEHSGWKVVSIPWFEWSKLNTAKERAEYLNARVVPLLEIT